MLSTKFSINWIGCLGLFHFLVGKLKSRKQKTYDFCARLRGKDYVFEQTENEAKGYMTAQCKGIAIGDYIILKHDTEPCCYQVEQIDYYSDPPDMWIALLTKSANSSRL